MRLWSYYRLFEIFGGGTLDYNGTIYRTPSTRRDQKATIA